MNYNIREQLRVGQGYVKDWDDWEAGKRKTKPASESSPRVFQAAFPS